MNTPVVLIIFNRQAETKRVLAELARVKPKKLFVVADGPRADRADEFAKCEMARAVIDTVDWDCQVFKNYSQVNLGCGRRPKTGISWVFNQVEEAIILEDDCVPHLSFFRYCEELLDRYRDEPRIMQIAGTNFACRRRPAYSYTFVSHVTCWGWATWRRAWKYHDMMCNYWPTCQSEGELERWVGDTALREFYSKIFNKAFTQRGDVDFWDYQWQLACWAQNGLSVSPSVNLVSNVGFGLDSTHTYGSMDKRGNLAACEMTFPLRHPRMIAQDKIADRQFYREAVLPYIPRPETVPQKIRRRVVSRLPNSLTQTLRNIRDGFI